MTTAFITCGGPPRRLGKYGLSQLIPVFGEPLICRTVRQCLGRKIVPVVMISPDSAGMEIRQAIGTTGARIILDVKPTCLCDTMKQFDGVPLGGRCLFLFGDVPYSEGSWKRILGANPTAIRCLGSFLQGEIFAISFPGSLSDAVRKHLDAAIASKATGKTDGTAWQFYRSVIDVPLGRHLIDDTVFIDIDDGFICDFDRIEKYEAFKKQWEI